MSTYADAGPVSGVRGWLGATLGERSGFVAAVTSLHVDGRFRERAVRVLCGMPGKVAGPALALRTLDHVPQVRERAGRAIGQLVRADTAEVVLDVLLAGANRQHAPAALAHLKAVLLADIPAEDLVAQLTRTDRRRVRRWAFELGHQLDVFTTEQLMQGAQGDVDPWIRAVCAEWLLRTPDPGVLAALLDAGFVEARLVAVTRVPDTSLSDDALSVLLVDRAPRVRDQARWRAHRRGWDVAGFYRRTLTDGTALPSVVVACLSGLAWTGDERDIDAAVSRLQHPSGQVRAAAVGTVEARATSGEAVELLLPALIDPSARVSAAASRALVRLRVPPSAAGQAWASGQPSSRRAGWRLARAAGGWHRVEADLRAASDPDPQLAALGRSGVENWLDVSAATTWEPLQEDQRARIASWLEQSDLRRDQQRVLAFHAGINAS